MLAFAGKPTNASVMEYRFNDVDFTAMPPLVLPRQALLPRLTSHYKHSTVIDVWIPAAEARDVFLDGSNDDDCTQHVSPFGCTCDVNANSTVTSAATAEVAVVFSKSHTSDCGWYYWDELWERLSDTQDNDDDEGELTTLFPVHKGQQGLRHDRDFYLQYDSNQSTPRATPSPSPLSSPSLYSRCLNANVEHDSDSDSDSDADTAMASPYSVLPSATTALPRRLRAVTY